MYNPSLKTDIEENNKTTRYNILLNDATKSDEADQRYSNYQQQLSEVMRNISEDESDEENDEPEEEMPMDIVEIMDSEMISASQPVQPHHQSLPNLSLSPLNVQIIRPPTTQSSYTTMYQPKCATSSNTVSSAQRYRQWQIIGGDFGDNYDILPPEEGEINEESEKELEEERDFVNDLNSFFDQVISAHLQRELENDAAPSNGLKCNCFRPDCRIKKYLASHPKSNTGKKDDHHPPRASQDIGSSKPSSNHVITPLNMLSDIISSNIDSAEAATKSSNSMLNLVIWKQKNDLDAIETKPYQHGRIEHHITPTSSKRSSQVISQCPNSGYIDTPQIAASGSRGRTPEQHEYTSSFPFPDLPDECSDELRKAHKDMLRHAGGITKVKRLYDELGFLANCLTGNGWRKLLGTSPKDGNTLLMWLCCQPFNTQQKLERKIGGVTLDVNRFLYSKIIAVVMAMIWDAYGPNNTKDSTNNCLLFARNSQEASSLELASLTNKSVVACWLALLYPCFGRDANETNQLGHTVLHFLARKGDEVADTLQELLRLRNPSKNSSNTSVFCERMFRLDVVNSGAKTPLDVAIACEVNSRKDGSSDTQYKKIISYFHDSIVEEAEEFECDSM